LFATSKSSLWALTLCVAVNGAAIAVILLLGLRTWTGTTSGSSGNGDDDGSGEAEAKAVDVAIGAYRILQVPTFAPIAFLPVCPVSSLVL
jgi:hypothetical protein